MKNIFSKFHISLDRATGWSSTSCSRSSTGFVTSGHFRWPFPAKRSPSCSWSSASPHRRTKGISSYTTCGQSYKHFMLVNYDPRGVPDLKISHITTIELKITSVKCLQDWPLMWVLNYCFDLEELRDRYCKTFLFASFAPLLEPWSSGNGKRLVPWRSWVRIPAPYTGWTLWCLFEKTVLNLTKVMFDNHLALPGA